MQQAGTSLVYGAFTVTHGLSRWTQAGLFSEPGDKTECLVRFSTPDAEHTPHSFFVRFFSKDGPFDIAGSNIPVQFSRQPGLRPPTIATDFWPLRPESLHYITLLFSDRGTPSDAPRRNGYASHIFSLTNSESQLVWCKFHFKTTQPITNLTHAQAGNFPNWRLHAQIMTQAEADALEFNPFDPTKIWPQSRFPLHEAGIIELNRPPAEAGPEAFDPTNLVPGIGYPPENLLLASPAGNDEYAQPGNLFRLMSPPERDHLIGNLVATMKGVPKHILLKQIAHFFLCDPAYGKGIADGLGLSLDQALAPESVRPKTAIG